MALRHDAPHSRPRLLLLFSLSCLLLPWASSSSVSRKLRNEEQLQYIQYLERPQTRTNRLIDSRYDALHDGVGNSLQSLVDDGSLLNLTLSRPHFDQSHSVVRHPRNHHFSLDEPVITSSDADSRGKGFREKHPVARTHRHLPSRARRRHSRRQTRPHPPPEHYGKRQEPPSRRYRARYRSAVHHTQGDLKQKSQEQPPRELASSPTNQHSSLNSSVGRLVSKNRNGPQPQRTGRHRARNPHYQFASFPISQPLAPISHQSTGRQFHGQTHDDPNYHPIPIVQHIYPQIDQRIEFLQPLSSPRPPPHHPPAIAHLQINSRSDSAILPQHQQHPYQQQQQIQQQQHHSYQQYQQREQQPEQTPQEDHTSEEDDDHVGTSMLRGADDLRVGKALNIFSRYGFLTLSVKVRPPVGEDNFLFLENTAEVFQRNSYWGKRETRRHRGNYDDHFYIHFCENLNELLIAYFDHFTIEGVPKAHKAFTSSLSVRDLARQFGISNSFLNGHFSFVLVRLFRRRRRSTLQGPLEMQGSLKQALEDVRVSSTESVHQFVDRFGSHVITEFEVGDMMYQTFVFGERLYKELKNKFAVVNTSENHLQELQLYFTPSYAASVGSVLLASGNEELNRILESEATSPELRLYPNIFRMFEDSFLEAELEKLGGEVVLSLKLEKITSKLPRSPETRWVSEVLDTTLAIYYQHMASTRKNS